MNSQLTFINGFTYDLLMANNISTIVGNEKIINKVNGMTTKIIVPLKQQFLTL